MKYTLALSALAATMLVIEPAHAATTMTTRDATIQVPMSAMEALDVAKKADLPSGVILTGTAEPVQAPSTKSEGAKSDDEDKKDDIQEWWGGGWGGWGGWGGFGPYRFGWGCGGLSGWAYPLGYWNTFGAGLYGGGCGLGLAWGGLYYC
ncbi:hypothetical protein Poli38472_000940 [Pythium oligandrum]|uniref:Glycine-rich protein n=1 Tax=Pythium oligandrum TaxID=41045 RepID=A0A8K1FJN1_PYTOL|nr:hypothetical protein Poli38472_000940 [Pythium oligandrum]|eukprot:TMW60898.1 hypothetical protein Poli38472_000940 [Pythium oligandrum]